MIDPTPWSSSQVTNPAMLITLTPISASRHTPETKANSLLMFLPTEKSTWKWWESGQCVGPPSGWSCRWGRSRNRARWWAGKCGCWIPPSACRYPLGRVKLVHWWRAGGVRRPAGGPVFSPYSKNRRLAIRPADSTPIKCTAFIVGLLPHAGTELIRAILKDPTHSSIYIISIPLIAYWLI